MNVGVLSDRSVREQCAMAYPLALATYHNFLPPEPSLLNMMPGIKVPKYHKKASRPVSLAVMQQNAKTITTGVRAKLPIREAVYMAHWEEAAARNTLNPFPAVAAAVAARGVGPVHPHGPPGPAPVAPPPLPAGVPRPPALGPRWGGMGRWDDRGLPRDMPAPPPSRAGLPSLVASRAASPLPERVSAARYHQEAAEAHAAAEGVVRQGNREPTPAAHAAGLPGLAPMRQVSATTEGGESSLLEEDFDAPSPVLRRIRSLPPADPAGSGAGSNLEPQADESAVEPPPPIAPMERQQPQAPSQLSGWSGFRIPYPDILRPLIEINPYERREGAQRQPRPEGEHDYQHPRTGERWKLEGAARSYVMRHLGEEVGGEGFHDFMELPEPIGPPRAGRSRADQPGVFRMSAQDAKEALQRLGLHNPLDARLPAGGASEVRAEMMQFEGHVPVMDSGATWEWSQARNRAWEQLGGRPALSAVPRAMAQPIQLTGGESSA